MSLGFGIFTESMSPTVEYQGDAMKPGYLYGHREKYIHSIGGIA